jgi:hypothetical protein
MLRWLRRRLSLGLKMFVDSDTMVILEVVVAFSWSLDGVFGPTVPKRQNSVGKKGAK